MSDSKEATLTTCGIEQQLDTSFFPQWCNDPMAMTALNEAGQGNILNLLIYIGCLLYGAGLIPKEIYGIIHDKDTRNVWDEITQQFISVLKPIHFHVVVKFEDNKGGTLSQIATAIKMPKQFIEKPKRGRYAYDNMLAYLIHIKYPNKFQYDPAEVLHAGYYLDDSKALFSNLKPDGTPTCRPYTSLYEERREDWLKGRAKVKSDKANLDIDWLEEKILTGNVTKSQIILTDEYFDIYARHKRRCEEALATYGERRAFATLQALNNGDFKKTILFVNGKAGSGKTKFTTKLCQRLVEFSETLIKGSSDKAWQVCQTAAKNPMDEYNGQEILFMDDVRGLSLSLADWLKLLDPYNISPASARYKNKLPACRVIIITSSIDPVSFFYFCRMGASDKLESFDQFMRRIEALVSFESLDSPNIPVNNDNIPLNVGIAHSYKGAETKQPILCEKGYPIDHVSMSYDFPVVHHLTEAEAIEQLVQLVANNHLPPEERAKIEAHRNSSIADELERISYEYRSKATSTPSCVSSPQQNYNSSPSPFDGAYNY